jgi:hypothetical protein
MLRFLLLNKTFQIAPDCQIVLFDGKSGVIQDIQPGNYVTVTYETPGDEAVANKIAQTKSTFIGHVVELNPTNRTIVAAKVLDLNSREFRLADNCAIVFNGKTNGQLSDLKVCDKIALTYHNIKGVDVVSYITNAPPPHSIEAKSPQMRAKALQTQAMSPRMKSTQ